MHTDALRARQVEPAWECTLSAITGKRPVIGYRGFVLRNYCLLTYTGFLLRNYFVNVIAMVMIKRGCCNHFSTNQDPSISLFLASDLVVVIT